MRILVAIWYNYDVTPIRACPSKIYCEAVKGQEEFAYPVTFLGHKSTCLRRLQFFQDIFIKGAYDITVFDI